MAKLIGGVFFVTFVVVCIRRNYGEANLGGVFLWLLLWCILALQKKAEGLGWRVWMMRTYGAATLRSVAVGAGFRPLPSQVYIYGDRSKGPCKEF